MAKPGPKLKIDADAERRIVAIVSAGGSLNDAADCIGVDRKTVSNRMRGDAEFSHRVKKAVAEGKIRLLEKIGKSREWKAAAWMLERKWGAEFGKKVEHRGKVRHQHAASILMRSVLNTPEALAAARQLRATIAGQDGHGTNGNVRSN